MKHGVWRAEYSIYNLKLKCCCFAFLHFLFLHSSKVSAGYTATFTTNKPTIFCSQLLKILLLSPSLTTVSDKLAVRIQDTHAASCMMQLSGSAACPPQPVGSSAARWARDTAGICPEILQLHCTTNYSPWLYSYTSPFLVLWVSSVLWRLVPAWYSEKNPCRIPL